MGNTIGGTLRHAHFLARHLNKCELQYAVVAVLLELGIPTKRIGFDYLKNAIMLLFEDPAKMMTKGIYPAVSDLYDPEIGEFQIEQAIRSAITEAWKDRDEDVWSYYFPLDKNGNVKKPTNSEFISRIARFMELWQGCCKEVNYARK